MEKKRNRIWKIKWPPNSKTRRRIRVDVNLGFAMLAPTNRLVVSSNQIMLLARTAKKIFLVSWEVPWLYFCRPKTNDMAAYCFSFPLSHYKYVSHVVVFFHSIILRLVSYFLWLPFLSKFRLLFTRVPSSLMLFYCMYGKILLRMSILFPFFCRNIKIACVGCHYIYIYSTVFTSHSESSRCLHKQEWRNNIYVVIV